MPKKRLPESVRRPVQNLGGSRATRPPLVRMIRIHDLLSAGRYPNCCLLAREFEVSAKTIQRDIDFMRDQLVLPIEYDRVRHGFAYSGAVGQFPLITVSEGELVALLVAQKAVEQYRGTSFEKPLRTAFQKLASSLGNDASVSLHDLSEAVSFHSAGIPRSQINVFELLTEAIMSSQLVEFDYRSLRARKAERRRAAPYHLACINNQWYLIAGDQARGQLRTFALTRIDGVKKLRTFFERPADFSASKMLSGSFAAFEAGKTERIRIHFDRFAARLVSERQWHSSQETRPAGREGIELTMHVGIAPDLESWILGWGDHAEVIEPGSLRDRISATVQRMAAKYRTAATPRRRFSDSV
jgi:predicted DNA-binding transcriptional regulator YafY